LVVREGYVWRVLEEEGSTQSTQKAGRLHNFSSCAWIRLLVEVEGDFDLHAAIYRLAAGAYRGRIFQFFTCAMAFSSSPRPGPLRTCGLSTRPSAVTVTSSNTVP